MSTDQPGPDEVAATVDHVAITRLQARYGDAVSRQAWDELVDLFEPDCPVRLDLRDGTVIAMTGPEEVGSLIASSIERFDFFLFTLLNAVVDLAPEGRRATGRLYIRELRRERDTGRWTTAYGLYRDSYVKTGGGWRFAARDYSSLARNAADGDGMDVFPIPGR